MSFLEAFNNANPNFKLELGLMPRERRKVLQEKNLQAIRSLLTYEERLKNFRSRSRDTETNPDEFDQLVSASNEAKTAYYDISAMLLEIIRVAKYGNELQLILDSLGKTIKTSGIVQASQIWDEIKNTDKVQQDLREAGIDDHLQQRLNELINSLPPRQAQLDISDDIAVMKYGDDRILLSIDNGKSHQRGQLIIRTRESYFDIAADSFLRTRRFNVTTLLGKAQKYTEQKIELAIVAGLAEGARTIDQHVSKLREVGPEVYRGNDPTATFLGIVALVAGALLVGFGLDAGNEGLVAAGFTLIAAGTTLIGAAISAVA